MVSVGGGSGCEVLIVEPHKPSDVFLVPLSTGVLYEFKMVTYLFVKSAEQLESHICPIERRLALFRFGYAWDCVAVDGNIGRGRCPEIVCLNN